MERKSGVLMHISSLFGDYSIGSFSDEAKYFIDFLKTCGFSYWQVLPLCVAGEFNSPYKSYSAFGGNPYFVDLKTLFKKGLLTSEELTSCRQNTPYVCEFERLRLTRLKLLKKASSRCKEKEKVMEFINSDVYLNEFCKFMALKEANDEKPWYEWTSNDYDEEAFFMWAFIQYEFFSQWKEIKAYANQEEIKIIGDIPMYVSLDSCDVWSRKDEFCLSKDFKPTFVSGVPPDYFSPDGQLWGNPIYDWKKMKQNGFKWWKERIAHASRLFDSVRIDHFRAFESYWKVPCDAKTAKEGCWEKGPGMKIIDVIKSSAKNTEIIAEDLGDITDEVRNLVEKSGFYGMRVFQFGFSGEKDSLNKPHNYPNNAVAYTGTHDNNTLLGYLLEMDDILRRNVLEYCGHAKSLETECESIIRTIFRSHAGLVILPIQDLMGFGSDTRLNIPGKAEGNWQFRITKDQLDSIDREYYRRLNQLYLR